MEFLGPSSRRSISGTLTAVDGKDGTKVFERRWRFRRGEQKISLKSLKPLPKSIQKMDVDWLWLIHGKGITSMSFLGVKGVESLPWQTKFEIFVTRKKPSTVRDFPDITYRRIEHAVAKVSAALSTDPHAIVKHLMSTFDRFTLGENPRNAWELGEPNAVGDCRTIVRYVINILLLVGIPGKARCVLVYEKLMDHVPRHSFMGDPTMMQLEREATKDDFKVVAEEPTESQVEGGLNRPLLIHPNGRWSLVLFSGGPPPPGNPWGPNGFEACLEFTYAGNTVFHAGGVKDFTKIEDVIKVFKSLSWAELDKGKPDTDKDDKMVPVSGKVVKTY